MGGVVGLAYPESGVYVIPGVHAPIEIDRERDLGVYVEPNVCMRHPIGGRLRRRRDNCLGV